MSFVIVQLSLFARDIPGVLQASTEQHMRLCVRYMLVLTPFLALGPASRGIFGLVTFHVMYVTIFSNGLLVALFRSVIYHANFVVRNPILGSKLFDRCLLSCRLADWVVELSETE
jgi:hypothetical protein